MKNTIAHIALILTVLTLTACGKIRDTGAAIETAKSASSNSIIESEEVEIIALSEKSNLEILLEFATSIEDVVFISPSGKLYSKEFGNIEEITFSSYPEEFVPETIYAREDSSADYSMIYYTPDAEAGTWKLRCNLSEGNSINITAYPV